MQCTPKIGLTNRVDDESPDENWSTSVLIFGIRQALKPTQKKGRTDSDKGPHNNGPTQYPATKREMVRVAISSLKEKYAMRFPATPDGEEDANVLRAC